MTLGDRVHTLRAELDLTLQELGDKVGVGASTVRKWETGYIKSIRADKLQKLAEALDTTVDYLMGWSDNLIQIDTNNGVIGSNSGGIHINAGYSKEEAELLRIFNELNVRQRNKLLNLAFELEEESQK